MNALWLLLSCATGTLSALTPTEKEPDSAAPEEGDADVDADADTDTVADTGADTAPTGEIEEGLPDAPAYPGACSPLYDPDILPTFSLTFTDEDWRALRGDCSTGAHPYRPVQFSYNGETVDAKVRLKGNWSWSCDKLQFVVSFNEVDPDARFAGQRKLMFDAPWYDHTLLHERVAFPIFAELGLPYSCANNARVEVNGSYYGVYANVERIDREYLERHFEEPDGNLYQAGSELKTNEDIGDTSNLEALWAATSVAEVEALMDLDQAVAEWAAEAMIPALDNYWAGVEINYYLYDHPSRGFVYLPYDLDISFGDSAYVGGGLIWPEALTADPLDYEHPGWRKESLVLLVLADPYWCGRFVEELERARGAYDPDVLTARVEAWSEQIAEAVAADPHKPYSMGAHDRAVAAMIDFFSARAAFVDGWLAEGGHCPG
jgi:hypothetical protein